MTSALAISASLACCRHRALAGHCSATSLATCINGIRSDHAAYRGRIQWLDSEVKANSKCYHAAGGHLSAKEAPTIPIDPRTDPAVSSLEA
jgi:hypothetical protein